MKLLVTNDDGIESVFLHELARALIAAGHKVFVAAPRFEQSWVGAAKSRNKDVRSSKADIGLGCPAWSVEGTPSDCVNIAIEHLLPEAPDAVVSGINVGLNAGLGFILASGTIAGAWEGALHGLPSIAISQDITYEIYTHLKYAGGRPDENLRITVEITAKLAARMVGGLVASTAAQSFIVHNLNFPYPCKPETTVKKTVPARVVVPRLFSPQAPDGAHRLVFRYGEDLSPTHPLTDKAALAGGFISHTELDYKKLGS